jgi:hypothetical protein
MEPTCVVWLSNDNWYCLMFSLSYIWRDFPYAMLENHVLGIRLDAMKIMMCIELRIKIINSTRVFLWRSKKVLLHSMSSLIHVGYKSWEDCKGRIHGRALIRGHDGHMFWEMVGQYLDHEIKWRIHYESQAIVIIEHEEYTRLIKQSATSRFKLVNT